MTANKQLLSSTARRCSTPRGQVGCSCASRRGGGRGAGDPGDGGEPRRPHRARARDRQRHHQLHPHRDGAHRRQLRRGARGRAAARLRGGRSDRGRDRQGRRGEDGDPRRLAFNAAVRPRPGELRGHRAPHRGRHRLREGAGPVAQADRLGRADRRRHRRARVPGLPVRGPPAGVGQRRVQRGHDRVARDHRDHPRARAPAASRPRAPCWATWSRR